MIYIIHHCNLWTYLKGSKNLIKEEPDQLHIGVGGGGESPQHKIVDTKQWHQNQCRLAKFPAARKASVRRQSVHAS